MRRLGEFANGASLSQFSASPLQGLWGGGAERSSSGAEKFSPETAAGEMPRFRA